MNPILFNNIDFKMKMKMKMKKQIVNFIPLPVLSLLGERLVELLKMVKMLGLDSSYSREGTVLFFIFRSVLFHSFGYDPLKTLNVEEYKSFLSVILSEFYRFKTEGFVNQENMEENKIFMILRSFYPSLSKVFDECQSHRSYSYELEHYHNLVILILLYELEKTLKITPGKDEITDLKTERGLLNKTLSGCIRSSISRNRLIILNKKYIAFDTEYTNQDSSTNKLLCYTTASVSETLLKIRTCEVNYSLTQGQDFIPKTSPLIEVCVKLIRNLRGKQDVEIRELENRLSLTGSLMKLELKNGDVIFKERIGFDKIKSSFFDLRSDPALYSFKKLLENHLEKPKETETEIYRSFIDLNLKPTVKNESVLLAHFTTADVSLFSDFDDIKTKFTVISKSFLTLDKFLTFNGWRVFLRDTALLSPSGMSLKSIGLLYPDLPLKKIELSKKEYMNMESFYLENPVCFTEYALQDAKIVLWHALEVQNSHYFFSKKYTIPVTLSSLASSYLETELLSEGKYHPPTQNGLITLRNTPKILTPTGVELSGDLHEYIDFFMGSYHGGRNESYIYGVVKGEFYDYDLPGAYPTAMAMLDYPNWESKRLLNNTTGREFYESYGLEKILKSYTALKVRFEFPSTVKYPNLPVRLDFSSVIFPLTGETFCTGSEFLLAYRLGCKIEILGGVWIPFISIEPLKAQKSIKQRYVREPLLESIFTEFSRGLSFSDDLKSMHSVESIKESKENYSSLERKLKSGVIEQTQFFSVVEKVLSERLKYPKGSYMNLLYKFIANAGIGQMARGLNQKTRYDLRSNSQKPIPAGELVSPLYAGWITSFIRTTLSEMLNRHGDGLIISCTTDGFISSKKALDQKPIESSDIFSRMYFETRRTLTGVGALLEQKYSEQEGVISWRTRGQLGLSGGIKALTGYQRNEPIERTIDIVNKSFNGSKQIPFIQKSLRSAKEIYLEGGHCTLKLTERVFNLKFDNRRVVVASGREYHETRPYLEKTSCIQARLISSFGTSRYSVYSPISSTQCKGDAYLSLTRRMLVRLLKNDSKLLETVEVTRVDIQKILKNIGLTCTLNFISKQKDKKFIYNSIPITQKTLKVLEDFTLVFPSFEKSMLLR